MKRNEELTDEPDDTITVVQCYGCEQLSFPADLQENGEVSSSQLCCPRCGTKISARDFYDYAKPEGATNE